MRFGVLLASLLVLVSFMSTGCGSKAGKGIPKRYPCQVKVTKGGTPLAGVMVIMKSSALESGVNVSGKTDENGIAQIETKRADFHSKGAPEGEYKVLLSKPTEELPDRKSPEELEEMSPLERSAYGDELERQIAELPHDVPVELGVIDTTPLTAKVTSAGGEVLAAEMDDYN